MSDPTTPETPRPRRRRLSMSLRAMMVLILLVGLPIGWKARRASLQRRAIATVQRAGGAVDFDYQWLAPVPSAEPPGPKWLRKVVGNEYFREVSSVAFLESVRGDGRYPLMTDDLMVAVSDFDHLDRLLLSKGTLGPAGLTRVVGLRNLGDLNLGSIPIDDDGLAILGGMTNLRSLQVGGSGEVKSPITAKGLAHLSKLTELLLLSIEGANFDQPDDLAPLAGMTQMLNLTIDRSPRDEACLRHVAGLRKLEWLELKTTEVTDAGLKSLLALDRLEAIVMAGNGVTDAGLAELARHSTLEQVIFRSLPLVTDAGIEPLLRLPKLDWLALSDSKLTDAGFARLATRTTWRGLDLSGTKIDDAGLARFAGQPRLAEIGLARTAITDAGLVVFNGMTRLEEVDLSATPITDAGLVHFRGLNNLTTLKLKGSKVTPAGVAALMSGLPGLKVETDWPQTDEQ